MRTSPRSRRTTVVSLFAGLLLPLALAACTSAPNTAATESRPSQTPSSTSGATGSGTHAAEYHEYELKLAQCFRDQGLDIEDPPADGFLAADGAEFQEAFPTCTAKIGNPPVREVTQDERNEALPKNLERAKCLREKGYDIVEPTLEDPGFIPAEVTEEDFETCRTD